MHRQHRPYASDDHRRRHDVRIAAVNAHAALGRLLARILITDRESSFDGTGIEPPSVDVVLLRQRLVELIDDIKRLDG